MFSRVRNILVVLFFLTGTIILFYGMMRNSKPPTEGSVQVEGVLNKVTIVRDKWGIPHIYGENKRDLYWSMGYTIASERLFQMDIQRRIANGELSEIFGQTTLEMDKLFRTMRFRKSAEEALANNKDKYSTEMAPLVESFYDGINYYMEHNPLPYEFTLLGYKPGKFSVVDGLAFSGYMGYRFAAALEQDFLFSQIKARLGSNVVDALRTHPLKRGSSKEVSLEWDKIREIVDHQLNGFGAFEGSNSWVLSGKKTESGYPILANDPHIAFTLPNIWFEGHMSSPDHEMYGHFIPILPFPILGHNREYGWAFTMSMVDDMDFYHEQVDDRTSQVKYRGNWVPLIEYEEHIKVRGHDDVVMPIRLTPHGPLMDNIAGKGMVSMKWAFHHPNNMVLEALYRMNHATNMKSFEKALSFGAAPGLNISYADRRGNIAWWVLGKIPVRKDQVSSDLLLDGSSGKDEYVRYRSFAENPRAINPGEGFIVSANYVPYTETGRIDGFWEPDDRYLTISSELKKRKKWNPDQVKELQTAPFNSEAIKILAKLLSVIPPDKYVDDELASTLLQKLALWDGYSTLGNLEKTVYSRWNLEIMRLLFDELSDDEWGVYCRLAAHWMSYKRLLNIPSDPLWDRVTTPDIENRDDVVSIGFEKALAFLKGKWGPNLKKWHWGEMHTLDFTHPLGRASALLGRIFNLGPYQVEGSYNDINNMRAVGCATGFSVKVGPSTRRVIDFSDPGISWGILPLGNSGHMMSTHYKDQLPLYLVGKYREQLLDRREIEDTKESTLVLSPREEKK